MYACSVDNIVYCFKIECSLRDSLTGTRLLPVNFDKFNLVLLIIGLLDINHTLHVQHWYMNKCMKFL